MHAYYLINLAVRENAHTSFELIVLTDATMMKDQKKKHEGEVNSISAV
jgi:hypothetical protein